MSRLILIFFSLHALALSLSIAGMEFATWSLLLIGVFQLIRRSREAQNSFKNEVMSLKLGPDWAILAYASIVTWSVLVMPPTVLSRLQILGFLRWIILLYVLTYLFRCLSEIQIRRVVFFFSLGLVLAATYGVFQFFTGIEFFRPHRLILYPYGDFFRATGFFSGSLTYAYSLGMGGLLVGGWAFGPKINLRAALVFVGAALGVAASMTRGAWLGVLGALSVYWIETPKKWRWRAALAGLVAVIGLFGSSESLRQRVGSLFDENVGSNRQRIAIWHSNWEIFKDYPLTGVGLTRNSEYLPQYYSKLGYDDIEFVSHAHSNYLQILAGAGIIGFVSYMAFVLYFLWVAFRLWRYSPKESWLRGLGLGALAAQILLHIGGFTECNFTDGEVNHMLIFIWALMGSQVSREA